MVSEATALKHFNSGEYQEAAKVQEILVKRSPDNPVLRTNYGAIFIYLNDIPRAREELHKALELGCKSANLYDGLAHVHGYLGDLDAVREYGRKSLLVKDSQVCGSFDYQKFRLNQQTPDNDNPNVIAFGLWGDNPRYIEGALRNIELCPALYPEWHCRFYIDDTVPKLFFTEATKRITLAQSRGYSEAKVEYINVEASAQHNTARMLCRFLVANDKSVGRFLVRDADSVINIKERIAVDEWILSGKRFHIIRDGFCHTELIHGGLWGGTAGALPPVNDLLRSFTHQERANLDQVFLRKMVWPLIRNDAKIHDQYFHGVLNGEPFSELGQLPPGRHIGQDEWARRNQRLKGFT